MEDWILNRRFFLYDTVTGIEEPGGFSTLEPASIVRYAKTMRLVVTLDANKEYNEMIYTPYLEINYEEKQKDMILEENDKMKDITFMAEYKMDTKSFWQLCKTLFWILFVVMLLSVLVFLNVQSNTERLATDKSASNTLAMTNGFFMTVDLFSTIFFWFLYAMTGWWFIFFKFQERVFVLMPDLDSYNTNYYSFDVLLGLVSVFKLMSLFFKIYFE
jgi:meckelin